MRETNTATLDSAPAKVNQYESMTIAEAIRRIQANEIALPLLQRNFVWDIDRITKLFDSILQGYPISSMLFWQVPPAALKSVQMYEFIKNYTSFDSFEEGISETDNHERNRNKALPCSGETFPAGVLAVLDGQQRLTSLYMSLCGTYAEKGYWKKSHLVGNYPPRALFLCVSDPTPDAETLEGYRSNRYQLQWREEGVWWSDEPGKIELRPFQLAANSTEVWMHVGQVMQGASQTASQWVDTQLAAMHQVVQEQQADIPVEDFAYARQTLERLHQAVFQDHYVSYYLERSQDLARAVETFIRVNNGGMQIGYADLLFSILTSEWKDRNAREAIEQVETTLNRYQTGLHLEKGFILKSALVMAAGCNLRFELGQFTSPRIKVMQENWPLIEKALEAAARLVDGGTAKNRIYFLSAPSLLLVLAYYHYRLAMHSSVGSASKLTTFQDEVRMRQWLIRAQLFWSSEKFSTETKLNHLIAIIANHFDAQQIDFPFQELVSDSWGINMSLAKADSEDGGLRLPDLLEKSKGETSTKFLLGLMQSNVQSHFDYDVDHCYPFVEVYGAEEWDDEHSIKSNSLGNLQLLTSSLNRSKSGTSFDTWYQGLDELLQDEDKRIELGIQRKEDLQQQHFYPLKWEAYTEQDDPSARLKKFEDFLNLRREKALLRLQEVFQDPA
jgi:hypothetical protein